jgi:hypothetical protein
MADNCTKHTFDVAHTVCRQCGQPFCTTCLVYAFGPKKPPFCVKCAIGASGVRSNAAPRPVHSKQQVRQMQKDAARAAKAAAAAAANPAPGTPPAYNRARMAGTAAATGTSPSDEQPGPSVLTPPPEKPSRKGLVSRFRS